MVRTAVLLCLATLSVLGCDADKRAREHVAKEIRARFGSAANPRVAFLGDSSHLLIHLDTTLFASMPDSAFNAAAKEIATVALREYQRAGALDSISVGAVFTPPLRRRKSRASDTLGVKIYRPPEPTTDPTMLVQIRRQRAFSVRILQR